MIDFRRGLYRGTGVWSTPPQKEDIHHPPINVLVPLRVTQSSYFIRNNQLMSFEFSKTNFSALYRELAMAN